MKNVLNPVTSVRKARLIKLINNAFSPGKCFCARCTEFPDTPTVFPHTFDIDGHLWRRNFAKSTRSDIGEALDNYYGDGAAGPITDVLSRLQMQKLNHLLFDVVFNDAEERKTIQQC